ncbi:AGE family epimerase/isomerase [uncultured Tenacibaculum sp.]|uniref:AGE family epimerase/isomerase n=1 Tax=uncultured Tenacibaculum sp. TaxID=174713 RepID=UPI0026044CD6|nr:AGE family epimerase/isomerase [uncultured Tenacibaculum sp.]
MHSLREEMIAVLSEVMSFWSEKTADFNHGGFYGELDFYGNPIANSTKGIILNARLLWSFAKVANHTKSNDFSDVLERSYVYIEQYFFDEKYSGVFWELDDQGNIIHAEKKAIAQAYTLLGLSEYYLVTKEEKVKNKCIELFLYIEDNFYNKESNFYYNELTRELNPIDFESKSLGTHLHLLEAYTNLYQFYKTDQLKDQIQNLFEILIRKFLHQNEFCELDFDKNWKSKTENISIGHNAEVPAMLLDFSEIVDKHQYQEKLISKLENYCQISMKLIDEVGGLYMFQNVKSKDFTKDFQWWMQTETIIAFQKLYEFTKEEKYLEYRDKLFNFAKEHFIDDKHGEWHEKLFVDRKPIVVPKVAMWKSPYHIVRMCTSFI